MTELEKFIVDNSSLKQTYHFSAVGAWDTLRLVGYTNEKSKHENCYVCIILKCAKKLKSSVAAMYSIVLINIDTLDLEFTDRQTPEECLSRWILDGSIEVGHNAIEALNNKYERNE